MAKTGVKLSPPWDTYVHYIESIFKGDPEVHLIYDEPNRLLKILVDEQEKYEAIDTIMPTSVSFGNVTLIIEVVPADGVCDDNHVDLFKKAFKGNPNVKDIVSIDMFGGKMNYMIFKKEVIQFFNDDLSDIHGVHSTLNETIARELFGSKYADIFFCTDTEN